jgi:hypothetical protein
MCRALPEETPIAQVRSHPRILRAQTLLAADGTPVHGRVAAVPADPEISSVRYLVSAIRTLATVHHQGLVPRNLAFPHQTVHGQLAVGELAAASADLGSGSVKWLVLRVTLVTAVTTNPCRKRHALTPVDANGLILIGQLAAIRAVMGLKQELYFVLLEMRLIVAETSLQSLSRAAMLAHACG